MRSVAHRGRLPARHLSQQILGLSDQLAEPFGEMLLLPLFRVPERLAGHEEELLEKLTELGTAAHEKKSRRLLFDRREGLQGLRVLIAEKLEIFPSLVVGRCIHSESSLIEVLQHGDRNCNCRTDRPDRTETFLDART
jgi:hypothetical protein